MNEQLEQKSKLNKSVFDTFLMISLFIFAGLNIFLLSINGLDFQQLYFLKKLPEGISLSDFVHEAVAGIIFSIVIAIVLISIILHHKVYNKTVKFLIYLWIVQSFIMLLNTAIRNGWYISYYQLTYLRFGVYVFLLCAAIGLAITAYCFYNKRKHWFLFSSNTRAWYFILVFAALLPWDRMITKFNLSHPKNLDFEYLINLSDNNLDLLTAYYKTHQTEIESSTTGVDVRLYESSYGQYGERLKLRTQYFLKQNKNNDWQCFSIQKNHLIQELTKKGLK